MHWKQGLTALSEVSGIDEPARAKLFSHHVTTAEELYGLIVASPVDVGSLLDLDRDATERLRDQVREAIPSETVTAIDEQKGRTYPLGARPPEEFHGD